MYVVCASAVVLLSVHWIKVRAANKWLERANQFVIRAHQMRDPNQMFTGDQRNEINGLQTVYEHQRAAADYCDSAIECCNKAIAILPNYARAYSDRASLHREKHDNENAIKDYTKVIDLTPNDAETYLERGLVYEEQSDYDRAIADYSKIIALNPERYLIYQYRGNAYYNNKDYKHAVLDLTKAIKDPRTGRYDMIDLYTTRSKAYMLLGDTKRANEDIAKIATLE
jgi:tetratricopeptide (TPR) repeat protein